MYDTMIGCMMYVSMIAFTILHVAVCVCRQLLVLQSFSPAQRRLISRYFNDLSVRKTDTSVAVAGAVSPTSSSSCVDMSSTLSPRRPLPTASQSCDSLITTSEYIDLALAIRTVN